MSTRKITAADIRAMKGREQIAALTAYDFPMARLLDERGIPLMLVGDSLGMVVLGYSDTTHVTQGEMEHHVRAVARAKPNALARRRHAISQLRNREDALKNAQSTSSPPALKPSKPKAAAKFYRKSKRSSPLEFRSSAILECCRNTCSKKAVTTSKANKNRTAKPDCRRPSIGRRRRIRDRIGTGHSAGRRRNYRKKFPSPQSASAQAKVATAKFSSRPICWARRLITFRNTSKTMRTWETRCASR